METTRPSRLAALYAGTIFVSAFLLFQIQPLISRFILPWFGGTPAVWTTCLVFFQTALFAGYLYAHLSEHYLNARTRTIVHLTLIVAALCTLPITPSDWWKPADCDYPAGRILTLLAVCVGLPYFLLSSTGPLVQAWFSQTLPGRSPYRLYSLSNLGSLLALLSYPFVVEPLLDGRQQSLCWTAGFVLFAVLCAAACWKTARLRTAAAPSVAETSAAAEGGAQGVADNEPAPSWLRRLSWLLLPAFASVLLLATTNHICLDVPAVPFLWVAPLSLYLLSFIIAFDHERWYRRLPFALLALVAVYLIVGISNPSIWSNDWLRTAHDWIYASPTTPGDSPTNWTPTVSYPVDLSCQLLGLFALCMLCHGELVRLRPKARYLTSFYLMISAGGALGGLAVSLIAPLVFSSYLEWKIVLPLGFALAAIVAFVVAGWKGWRVRLNWQTVLRTGGILVASAGLVEIIHLLATDNLSASAIYKRIRNFYGVLSVAELFADDPQAHHRILLNGNTRHGMQFVAPQWRQFALTYYSDDSGVGKTIEFYQDSTAQASDRLRIGAVGLGVGTLAAYVYQSWHTIRFYEINPEVCRLAETDFSYLADARGRTATVEIVPGDARLSLQRELETPQAFNVLVLDAFASDSIPIHLLTKEAFEIYVQHLAPGGAIAVHISNRNIDLAPVAFGLAEVLGFEAIRITTVDSRHFALEAEWVILSQNHELIEKLQAFEDNVVSPTLDPPFIVWTDHWHNLLPLLHWPSLELSKPAPDQGSQMPPEQPTKD